MNQYNFDGFLGVSTEVLVPRLTRPAIRACAAQIFDASNTIPKNIDVQSGVIKTLLVVSKATGTPPLSAGVPSI